MFKVFNSLTLVHIYIYTHAHTHTYINRAIKVQAIYKKWNAFDQQENNSNGITSNWLSYIHKIRGRATQNAVNMLNKSVKKNTRKYIFSRHKTIGGKNKKRGGNRYWLRSLQLILQLALGKPTVPCLWPVSQHPQHARQSHSLECGYEKPTICHFLYSLFRF